METIPYFGHPTRTIPVYPRIWAKCVQQGADDIAWAKALAADPERLATVSTLTLDTMHRYLRETTDQRARHRYSYWHMRANMTKDYLVIDPTARREWVELGGVLETVGVAP